MSTLPSPCAHTVCAENPMQPCIRPEQYQQERDEALTKYDMVCRRCDDATAERDAFRAALEKIAYPRFPTPTRWELITAARRALESNGPVPEVRGPLRDALWGTP